MPPARSLGIEGYAVPPEGLSDGSIRLRFEGVVPAERRRGLSAFYHFRIVTLDGDDAGHINLRLGDTDHVRLYAGHVGYEVRPEFRGRGYAWSACRALAPFARAVCSPAILTSDPENTPSVRTIERLGARFLGEVDVPPDDPQYDRGSRRKRRYEWRP